jgi:uncharacterized membrane protein
MNPVDGHHMVDVLVRNLSWMTGNLFLAWAPMLFAWHLRGGARAQRIAATTLMVTVPLILFARLTVRGATVDAPAKSLALVALVGAAAALWSIRVRAGDRWARGLGYVGVLAFAPNAPYVMTDLFHHVQDVRLVSATSSGGSLVGNVLTSIEYGWFLVLGTAAWIALVDAGRDWLRRHHPGIAGWRVLVPVGAVMAFGIYLGRIERFHSWHPLGEPGRFASEVALALVSPGPIAFTITWWLVVVASAWIGLRLLDRARGDGGRGVGALVVRTSWTLSAILLATSPLVPIGYHAFGVGVPEQGVLVTVASVALGTLVAGWAIARGMAATPTGRRGLVVAFAVPALAMLLVVAAFAQWYAQFRGLCEYGPSVDLHGDAC